MTYLILAIAPMAYTIAILIYSIALVRSGKLTLDNYQAFIDEIDEIMASINTTAALQIFRESIAIALRLRLFSFGLKLHRKKQLGYYALTASFWFVELVIDYRFPIPQKYRQPGEIIMPQSPLSVEEIDEFLQWRKEKKKAVSDESDIK